MLHHKSTTIVSEINDFFTSSEKSISTILNILSSLTLSEKQIGLQSKNNNLVKNISKLYLLTSVHRKEEYFQSKINQMIEMIRTAIAKGVRFDYVLVDSWFTCFALVKFIKTRRIKTQLIGMAKMGKTRYTFNEKALTAKEIIDHLRKSKKLKRSKYLSC